MSGNVVGILPIADQKVYTQSHLIWRESDIPEFGWTRLFVDRRRVLDFVCLSHIFSKAISQGPYVGKDILAQKRVAGDGEFGYELLMDGPRLFWGWGRV